MTPLLLDNLVGVEQERLGNGKAERLRRLEIHDQLELARELHRQVTRLGAFEDAVHIGGALAVEVGQINPVGNETAGCREEPVGVDRRNTMTSRQRNDAIAVESGYAVWRNQ